MEHRIRSTNMYIQHNQNEIILFSYNVRLFSIRITEKKYFIYVNRGWYSKTTTKHYNYLLRFVAEFVNVKIEDLKKIIENNSVYNFATFDIFYHN